MRVEPKERVDVEQPGANMYGCTPCPRCGQDFRYSVKNVVGILNDTDIITRVTIVCDDCGLEVEGE